MSEEMPQAYVQGQVADGLNAGHQAEVAVAIMDQEDKIAVDSRFVEEPKETLKNDKATDKSFSKFTSGVKDATNDVTKIRNSRRRSGLSSDSPIVELLQEVLELVEDLSYAAAQRRVTAKNKSSFTSSKFKKHSKAMTSTSKYALSVRGKNTKAKIKRDAKNQARLQELKTLHATIKRALQSKHMISTEQVDKIKKGVIAMRNDIYKELGQGQSIPKLEANKSLNHNTTMSM